MKVREDLGRFLARPDAAGERGEGVRGDIEQEVLVG